ncbi:MAG TPA: proton-conducting transporter membrane subunit, partial [Naasia sp.]
IVVQTTLFLSTGLIERVGGTTSISRLGGLLKASPVVAVLFLLPALNLGGIPPFSGFLGKLGLLEASAEVGTPLALTLLGAAVAVSLLTLYPLARVWNLAFWRPREEVAEYSSALTAELGENPFGESASGRRALSRLMIGATAGMVAVSVGLSLAAGPLYGLASRAGADLQATDRYIESVLGGER